MKLRQIYPLLLAHADDDFPIQGRTRFQKIIFLLQAELFEKDPSKDLGFGFIPYNYGPYSATLQSDIDSLIDEGLLRAIPKPDAYGKYIYKYEITEKGKNLAEKLLFDEKYAKYSLNRPYNILNKIKAQANYKDLDSLLKEVYTKHPEYAKNSLYEF